MTWFSQQDNRWSSLLLGYNQDAYYNIGRFGCVITAWGNMLIAATGDQGYTPAMVNRWMVANNGFLPGGGVFIWSAALGMGHVNARGTTADLNALNAFLQDPPNFAIVEVNASGRQHFCLAPFVNKIVDSEDGEIKPMSTYPFVSAHLYTALALPTPPAPPTSGDLNAIANVRIPLLNARTEPNTSSPAVAQFHAGPAHVTGWVNGQTVAIAGKTDNVWLRSDAGHYASQAGFDSNFGHTPMALTPLQKAHLAASESVGMVTRLLRKRKK